jgi:hypothetical protein
MKFTWFGKIVPKDGVLEIPKPKKGDRGKR